MVVICPHCGDRTEQEWFLPEFTCGVCDRPFRTPMHIAMQAAYDALHDDNDADSAERILRAALQGSANRA